MYWQRAVFLVVIFLVGCVSKAHQLGLSEQQWQQMTEAKRQNRWMNYQKINRLGYNNAMKLGVIYRGQNLAVGLAKGSAMMPPFEHRYQFQSQSFGIRPGQCQSVTLKSIDAAHQVALLVCYNGSRLAFDPSRYLLDKQEGTVFIDYNPIWTRGLTYTNFHTDGYVRLQDMAITIKAGIAKND